METSPSVAILGSTDSITALMAGAVNTTNPVVNAQYENGDSLLENTTSLDGVTAVELVPAPTGGLAKTRVKRISIYNIDAVAQAITVRKKITDTNYSLAVVTLQPGDTLLMLGDKIAVQSNTGAVKSVTTQTYSGAAYAANGAIAEKEGLIMLTKAGVGAMTLANPTAGTDDYKRMCIMAATANAHTVTNTTGFGAGGAGLDVATFGGAVGDNMVIRAYQGLWYVESTRNVTLG